jgi:hypothetical protein
MDLEWVSSFKTIIGGLLIEPSMSGSTQKRDFIIFYYFCLIHTHFIAYFKLHPLDYVSQSKNITKWSKNDTVHLNTLGRPINNKQCLSLIKVLFYQVLRNT